MRDRPTFLLCDAMTDGEQLFTDDSSSVEIDRGHFIESLGAREDYAPDLALFVASTPTHTLTGCVAVEGPCGAGTLDQPTDYLDRVGGICPDATPVFRGFALARCGDLGTPNQGMLLRMTCCAIAAP